MNSNPVALITGAAIRVGRAIALRMADAGFDIAFTYLTSQKPADQLVQDLRAKGKSALAIQADLTQPENSIDPIYKSVFDRFARLDLLVNSASIYEKDAQGVAAIAQMRRLSSIHIEAPLLLARTFTPMLKAAGGSIINMVDLMAERPIPGYLNYCASKAGLWNLTLGLARALAPEIRVNAIAPGVVQWPQDYPLDEREKYLRRVPLARPGTPADVAQAVHFLATTGTYITGQILRIDGGRSIS